MDLDRPARRDRSATRLALWAAVVVALLAVVAVGPVAPDSADGNYTVYPEDQPKDRRPAENDTTWNHLVATNVSLDVESIEFRSNAGSFEDCTASTIGTLGVDRGNDANGTSIDESLQNRTDRTVNGPNRLQFEFEAGNNSSLPALGEGDQLVAVPVECFDNPDEAGWYKFKAWVNGTVPDGNSSVALNFSEWVGVCNCEGDEEAYEVLGPPIGTPSPSPTPMPTPTPTDTPDSTPSATPTAPNTTTATMTAGSTATPTAEPTTASEGTSSPTEPRTPTDGDGTGFGGLLAVAAVVGVSVALRRGRADN